MQRELSNHDRRDDRDLILGWINQSKENSPACSASRNRRLVNKSRECFASAAGLIQKTFATSAGLGVGCSSGSRSACHQLSSMLELLAHCQIRRKGRTATTGEAAAAFALNG